MYIKRLLLYIIIIIIIVVVVVIIIVIIIIIINKVSILVLFHQFLFTQREINYSQFH